MASDTPYSVAVMEFVPLTAYSTFKLTFAVVVAVSAVPTTTAAITQRCILVESIHWLGWVQLLNDYAMFTFMPHIWS